MKAQCVSSAWLLGLWIASCAWSGPAMEFERDPNSPAVYPKLPTASSPRELVLSILEAPDADAAAPALAALKFLEHPWSFDQVKTELIGQLKTHPLRAKWKLTDQDLDAYAANFHALLNRWFNKPGMSWTWPQVEQWIREGPTLPAGMPTGFTERFVRCDHLDCQSHYYLYVPTTYDSTRPAPLLVLFNGGNADMEYFKTSFISFTVLVGWIDLAEKSGWILAAPAASRGWAAEGFSLLRTTIDDVKRRYAVDPDRVCGWGQSLGGHAAWKLAMSVPDWWAGLAPVCGGYGSWGPSMVVTNNLPLYHVWGEQDGMSVAANRSLANQLKTFDYDVKSVAKPGGHLNYEEEYPNILAFFTKRPRHLYPRKVIAHVGDLALMGEQTTGLKWKRPLPWMARHYWLECVEKILPGPVAKLTAEVTGPNAISLSTENVKTANLYLHEKMGITFDQPVQVAINGRAPQPFTAGRSLDVLFEGIRRYQDRGRIYSSVLTIDIPATAPPSPAPRPPP